MTYAFARRGPIWVTTRLELGAHERLCQFILDTGAERTLLSLTVARQLQMPLEPGGGIWTASRRDTVSAGRLDRLDALGITRRQFGVLVGALPEALRLDGLLGLDFLRESRLAIDFRAGTLTVS